MHDAFVIGLKPRQDDGSMPTDALSRRVGGNTGNLVYAHAICAHLAGNLRVIDIGAAPQRMNGAGRVGVIQGANQLGAHFAYDEWARRFEQLTVGLVVVGLGAQSDVSMTAPELPPSALEWVRRIVERAPGAAPNLGVRGQFTKDVLCDHGFGEHARIVGCPSLFINPDRSLGRTIAARLREPRRVAVVAGHESWQRLADIEASLVRLVRETNGSYIGQHGLNMMRLTRGEAGALSEADLEALSRYLGPEMSLGELIRWSRNHGNVFFDVLEWMRHCRQFDFVVGTRIHGTVVALQAGVPALCIVHDSRTRELCETMLVPHVLADSIPRGIARDELLSWFSFDAEAFDANRRRLCGAYVEFLEGNGLVPVPWLSALV
ncbi:MAG: polysaccharide pyruvyl transferase family protein [Gammaproteobacteria bacterium]|nr:polysaccharide pyruvyl transferase family protein [Gammaproteobacteria bacterium]